MKSHVQKIYCLWEYRQQEQVIFIFCLPKIPVQYVYVNIHAFSSTVTLDVHPTVCMHAWPHTHTYRHVRAVY
jgi:hypothetical protein